MALITLALSGCGSTETREVVRDAREKIAKAEKLWKSASIRSYNFTVDYSTFALTYGCTEQSFTVVNGRSTPTSARECASQQDVLGTIPALFRLARKELRIYPDEASFLFDPDSGYPIKFYRGSADAEDIYFTYRITSFERAK